MHELIADSICNVCDELIYPGEIHYGCIKRSQIGAINQCIICLEDEREGDHSLCVTKANVIRERIISVIV